MRVLKSLGKRPKRDKIKEYSEKYSNYQDGKFLNIFYQCINGMSQQKK